MPTQAALAAAAATARIQAMDAVAGALSGTGGLPGLGWLNRSLLQEFKNSNDKHSLLLFYFIYFYFSWSLCSS